jgi:hypothetical protein
MNKVLIASIGVEGGGLTTFGRESEGIWSFWSEGSSMDLDENEDEVWRSWSSELVGSLDLVLPKDWPPLSPIKIHQEFVGWCRANYDLARASMHEQERWEERKRSGAIAVKRTSHVVGSVIASDFEFNLLSKVSQISPATSQRRGRCSV